METAQSACPLPECPHGGSVQGAWGCRQALVTLSECPPGECVDVGFVPILSPTSSLGPASRWAEGMISGAGAAAAGLESSAEGKRGEPAPP